MKSIVFEHNMAYVQLDSGIEIDISADEHLTINVQEDGVYVTNIDHSYCTKVIPFPEEEGRYHIHIGDQNGNKTFEP